MFSLIVTIISIALVAALALATLYYGGAAFNKSSAMVEATRLTNQATQLQGAAELYRADRGAYPRNIEDLVTHNYLKSIPVAQASPLMGQALAEGFTWTMVLEGYPVFALSPVSLATCQGINQRAYGEVGVLKAAREGLGVQCYGTDVNNLTVVSAKTGEMLQLAATSPTASVSLGAVSTAPVPALDSLDSSINGWLGVVASAEPPVTPLPVVAFESALAEPLNALSFAPTRVGETSAPQTLVIRNTGTANLVFTAPGVAVPASFELASNACSATTVIPGDSCQVSVTFKPLGYQAYAGALSVQANAVEPVSVTLSGTGLAPDVVQVVSGPLGDFTFVKKTTGEWFAGGRNQFGQLGTGDLVNRLSFVAVPALNGATQLALGAGQTFARLPSGNWVAAGNNVSGQLGLGHTTNQLSFTAVPALNGATQVVGGYAFTLARLATGNWVAAGDNSTGALGLGHTTDQHSFTAVAALNGATQAVAGDYQTFARLASGNWVAAGFNGGGQLGLGYIPDQHSFVVVPALNGATQAVAGKNQMFARLSNGTWVVTGDNGMGMLGLGHFDSVWSFVAAPALNGATQVALGAYHTLAQLSTGTWVAAGRNSFGQLGLGSTSTNRSSFVGVTALAGATQVVAGGNHTIGRRADGTWAGVGRTNWGQLGTGGTATQLNFVDIAP